MKKVRINIEQELARAEHVDFDFANNTCRLRYQDGREVMYQEVRIHFPSLVRELLLRGDITAEKAKMLLDKGPPC